MRIKATIVAYAFLVQYFENATIVAFVGLRVNIRSILEINNIKIDLETTSNILTIKNFLLHSIIHNQT